MRTSLASRLVFAAVVAGCASAFGADEVLPKPSCEPSRACAFELALAAGRQNLALTKDSFQFEMAHISIALMQLTAGDRDGARATVVDLGKLIDGPGGRDIDSMRASLADFQARVGMQQEAMATARRIRKEDPRNSAWQSIARELAARGDIEGALAAAKRVGNDKMREFSEQDVMREAVKQGRRPDPTPHKTIVLQDLIAAGELARARETVLKIPGAKSRSLWLGMIAQKAEETKKWDDLAVTARLMSKDAQSEESDFMREINYELAAEWLIQARAFDDALAVIPHAGDDDRSRLYSVLAIARAQAGEIEAAEKILPRVLEWQSETRAGITVGKVLAGKLTLDQALELLPRGEDRSTSLTSLGELLPDSRREEARRVLNLLAESEARLIGNDRDYALRDVAFLQVERGFFSDALETARRMTISAELLAAYSAIGLAQAKLGKPAEARKTFSEAEAQARKYGFGPEEHAQLTGALGEAGLLVEAFEQVKSLSRRPKEAYFFHDDLNPVIIAHMKAGQILQAYQIAMLLSEHDRGEPQYFLVIAAESKP